MEGEREREREREWERGGERVGERERVMGTVGAASASWQAQLLELQSKARADPEAYALEIRQQYAHFASAARVAAAEPARPPPELKGLLSFLAHVLPAVDAQAKRVARSKMREYTPEECVAEAPRTMTRLLRERGAALEAMTRRALGKAVVQLHARGLIDSAEALPLCFESFRCRDFALRTLLFQHVVSHLSKARGGVRGAVAGFLYRMVLDDDEVAAKKSLAVVMALYRNNTWRDSKAVGVVAAAVGHRSGRVLRAACNFFLGQDADDDDESEDDDDDDDDEARDAAANASAITRHDVYSAQKKGTIRTKKKKKEKLKKVQKAARKAARKAGAAENQGFTAIQLLADPQGFVEKVYERLNRGAEPFDTRLVLMQVISRTIGVHQLLLLNLYPLLQRYMQPHQRNVTVILASLVQACHQGVPPDVLDPVLRQLLDSFISDKSRPEVMTVGLKTVREMAMRCPLLLGKDLLSDLVEYKKYKDKGVSSAARSLISLYRDIAPHMLHKKERGKGADMNATIADFGFAAPATRVDGAELLENGDSEDDDDDDASDVEFDDNDDDNNDGIDVGNDSDAEGRDADEEEDEDASGGDDESDPVTEADEEGELQEDDNDDGEDEEDEEDIAVDENQISIDEIDDTQIPARDKKRQRAPEPGSLRSLRRAAKEAAAAAASTDDAEANPESQPPADMPIEQTRFLTNEDFARIKRMKTEASVSSLSARYGARAVPASESRMKPEALEAHKVRGHDKSSRLATVMKGREDRGEFGAASDRKKKKTGGLSNKEKARKKTLPKGVLNSLARSRAKNKKKIGTKKKKKLY